MWWRNKTVESLVKPISVKPPDNVITEFQDLAMVAWSSSTNRLPAEWVNWAIDYTSSDREYVVAGIIATFKDLRVMHEAALKYAKDGGDGQQ